MSGDNIQSAEGGEVTAISPDEGNTVIETQPDEGDTFGAAELEAVKEFTSTDDEATEEEIVEEEVAKDPEPEDDQTDEEAKDEVVPEESPKPKWDGNPDNLSEELVPAYKSMLKGFHAKMREADKREKEADKRGEESAELSAKLSLKLAGAEGTQAEPEAPPPLPTGDSITPEAWNDAVTKQNAWYAEQNRTAMLAEMEKSDKFVSSDQFAEQQREAEVSKTEVELRALPGFTPAVEELMLKKAAESTFWATALTSREGAFISAHMAIEELGSQAAQTAAAAKETAKVQKQATAASRATPRVSSPAGAAPENVFAKNLQMTEDEKMEVAERQVREKYGG